MALPPVAGVLDVCLDLLLDRTARRHGDAAPAPVAVADPTLAAALTAAGRQVHAGPVATLEPGSVGAVVLEDLPGEGIEAEILIDAAATALTPGGLLIAACPNRVFAELTGGAVETAWDAATLTRALGARGFAVDRLCAPGAAAALRAGGNGAGPPAFDPAADAAPGLLGAAAGLLAVASAPRHANDRNDRFFAALPRKVVAAAVLCRDEASRLLCVHDAFKGHWTIPGGVVAADESPRDGAEREAWEETGVRLAAGAALGLFAGTAPDRLVVVYDAVVLGGGSPLPQPRASHEIDAADWLALPEALERLAPAPAWQVRRCLTEPGGTWVQSHA